MTPGTPDAGGKSGWVEGAGSGLCYHPGRPEPRREDTGRVWWCAKCLTRFAVRLVDHGHDVMPGEASYSMRWERVG